MAVAAPARVLIQLCFLVGKLHPKPYTAKIQSAATICGGYLGHDVPKDKKTPKNWVKFMQTDNNEE